MHAIHLFTTFLDFFLFLSLVSVHHQLKVFQFLPHQFIHLKHRDRER